MCASLYSCGIEGCCQEYPIPPKRLWLIDEIFCKIHSCDPYGVYVLEVDLVCVFSVKVGKKSIKGWGCVLDRIFYRLPQKGVPRRE